jgi:glycosyltransferase involved in cell wall biosynthesis
MHFLTPTYRPAGGVVKIFDYLVHALDMGYEAQVRCPLPVDPGDPLWSIPRFSGLCEDPRVGFHDSMSVGVGARDWVVFSWPPHYEEIARGMSSETPHERVVHLVQNTRHANPSFAAGYAIRLLARPMARIMVSHEVMAACRPHLNERSACATIVEGHDWPFFDRQREGGLSAPVRVGYTTWKSGIGVEIQRAMDDRFSFRSIRRTASWQEVRELLHWCDIFLCCPGPEEGFYLPGLEALAAGALVVTPDVGGNRAYCRFGENCLLVGHDRLDDYVTALTSLAGWPSDLVSAVRRRGYETVRHHTLDRERSAFGRFLVDLSTRRIGSHRALTPPAWLPAP